MPSFKIDPTDTKAALRDLDDETLREGERAWANAVEASRAEAHIDVADYIRNQYVIEIVRRRNEAAARVG